MRSIHLESLEDFITFNKFEPIPNAHDGGKMMLNIRMKLFLLAAILFNSSNSMALPFDSFDPRSMAMGSTGVAVGDPSTAPFFNPAMLTASDPSKKYSIEFPVIGARLYDPANMHKNLPTLSDDITALNNSITTLNTNSTSINPAVLAQVPANMNTVASNIDKVNSALITLDKQPMQAQFGAATVVGIPGNNWGFAFYSDAWGAAGGTLEYNDGTTLSNLSADVKTAANVLSGATSSANNPAAQTACLKVQNGTALPADVTTCINYAATLSNLSSSLNNASNVVNFNTNNQITSKIHIRGVVISEAGLSISHNLVTYNQSWSLGITPKVMNLQLFDALLSANNGNSTSGVTGNDYLAKYNAVNFDIGVAKSYSSGWRTGLVVKNVVPQSFDFKAITAGAASGSAQQTTGQLNMNPQARLGVSHENAWSTVALDVDLAKNNPAGLESKSQYAGIGGELSAWGWAQIRAGFRSDLLNKGQDLISLGFGLSPRIPYFKPHLDFAVTASRDVMSNGWDNATQAGASLKLGFNF
jgi:hypothetical protein